MKNSIFNLFKKQDPHEGQVKCETCKHWVDEKDTYVVAYYKGDWNQHKENYCIIHKKPYYKVILPYTPYEEDATPKYFGELEMTELGEPIGYKKINNL